MRKTHKIILLIINFLLCATAIAFTFTLMSSWSGIFKIALTVAASAAMVAEVVFFFLKGEGLYKSLFILVAFFFIAYVAMIITDLSLGLGQYSSDGEKIDKIVEVIRSTGGYGMAVFILLQVLQVVILPLPAFVCYVSGTQIWSPLTATLLASVGVIIGSFIDYAIGRFFGKKVVSWIAGRENTEKYSKMIGKKSKGIFIVMQILPFFPDDLLCMLAGLAEMNIVFFSVVMVIVRPVIIAVYCFLGSGNIIPFSGWGIPVWIAIGAACIAFAVLSFKYQDKFENWLNGKFAGKREEK